MFLLRIGSRRQLSNERETECFLQNLLGLSATNEESAAHGDSVNHFLETQHSNGKVSWSHKMLEAKIVSENGLSLSICSEAIENEAGTYNKQDCELKAFYRMTEKLKKAALNWNIYTAKKHGNIIITFYRLHISSTS